MDKPRHTEELLKIIFLWSGIAFVFMGILSFVGILIPTEGSMVQDSTVIGIVFVSLGLIL